MENMVHSSSEKIDESYQPKTVLVTGGAGFIGSHVADVMMGRGDRVVIVDEMNDYYDVRQKQANLKYLHSKYGAKMEVFRGDICDVDFMSDIFERERPTHVCHLAARAGVRPSIVDPYIYVHSNIEGTTRLLDLARQYSCKNFVYASSSSVYGCSTNEILSESDSVEKPVSPYAATKKACELLAYTFHHLYGLNCTGLRFFTVYGPRGRPDMAPFKFIDRVFNGNAIQQYGDGSTSRDYTYIDDIVAGVVAAVDKPLGCEVVNLGNGRPFLLRDFIALVESSVGKEANIEVLPCQPGDVDRTCANINKARELLGYNPKVPFEEGIRRTADWYAEAHAAGLFSASDDEEDSVSSDGADCCCNEADDLTAAGVRTLGVGKLSSVEAEIEAEMFGLAVDDLDQLDDTNAATDLQQQQLESSEVQTTTATATTAAVGRRRIFGLKSSKYRNGSDLELSSYVEPAPVQVTQRARRFFGII